MPTHKSSVATLTAAQLAECTGVSEKTVARRLGAAGIRPLHEDGRSRFFDAPTAIPVVLGVGEGLVPSVERARLDKARADFQELRVRERSGELLEAADVKSEWSRRVLNWKERIRSVPAAATVYIGGFTKEQGRALLKLIDETLVELADGKGEPKRKRAR